MIVVLLLGILALAALVLHIKEPADKSRRLERIFPLWKIEDGLILSKQGDLSVCHELQLPELFTLSDEQHEGLHQAWIKAIKLLPLGAIVHKQDWFLQDRFEADFTAEKGFLGRASNRHFHERPFMNHHCYLVLSCSPEGRKASSSVFSSLLRSRLVPVQAIDQQRREKFLDACGQFIRVLEDTGVIKARRLQNEDLIGDEDRAGLLEKYLFLLPDDRPQLRDIVLKPVWKIGNQFVQLFSLSDVADLPAHCGSRINHEPFCTERTKLGIGFAAPVGLLLDCNHICNQFLVVQSTPKTLKRLEAKRRRLQSLSLYSRENAISLQATNQFLNECVADSRLPVKAHFHILAFTDQEAELKDLGNKVAAALARMDAIPRQETQAGPQLFWAALPGNAADLPINDCFDTFCEQAVCFFNQETCYRDSVSPVGIRFADRVSGHPLWVDLSDLPMTQGWITNRAKFILGPSGSGKSYLVNLLLRHYYEQGSHIVVIDVGHSYRGLCSLVNGYYFTYSPQNPISFNPFFLGAGEELDTEKKESIKTLLLALWKHEGESQKRSEYVALSDGLTQYFAYLETHPDLFPCFDTFYEFLRDHFLPQLRQEHIKDEHFDAANFMYVLRPYYGNGEFAFLLNARQNLELLSERFIIFELDAVKEHPVLFRAICIILMQLFVSKLRKLRGVRKIICIEEAWKAIASDELAEYIRYLFKTIRKFYGEPWIVTQDVEDIISSPVIKQAILNNTDCKILCDQRKYANKFDQVEALLGLSAKEKSLILSMNRANDPRYRYREVFISLGGMVSKVYRIEVSREEHFTYTTEEKEKYRVQQAAEKLGSMEKAIEAVARGEDLL